MNDNKKSDILLIETVKPNNNSVQIHSRTSKIISDHLNIDFYYPGLNLNDFNNDYKKIIWVHGTGWSELRPIRDIIRFNFDIKKTFWITNEYTNSPNGSIYIFLYHMNYEIIANYVQSICKSHWWSKYHLINLNSLIFDEKSIKNDKKIFDIIYFGSFRENRLRYFNEYLRRPLFLSASNKALKKFKRNNIDAYYSKSINWDSNFLSKFKYSLYIEDEINHKNYNHLANRFYECLMSNVVQFFDINCINTIRMSGITFHKYFFVKNRNDLYEKVKSCNYRKAWNFQKKWIRYAIFEKQKAFSKLKRIFDS